MRCFRWNSCHEVLLRIDETKIGEVQIYLHGKTQIAFEEAKDAVIKAHRRIGRLSLFDTYNESKLPPVVSQTDVNAELLAFLQNLRLPPQTSRQQAIEEP